MKLFFDENLSHKLPKILANEYPKSTHVRNEGLRGASDLHLWKFCKENDYIIVSKDTDFRERSYIEGHPPKIVWLDVGNSGTMVIADLLKNESKRINQFIKQEETSIVILSIGENAI